VVTDDVEVKMTWESPLREVTVPVNVSLPSCSTLSRFSVAVAVEVGDGGEEDVGEASVKLESEYELATPTGTLQPPSRTLKHARSARLLNSASGSDRALSTCLTSSSSDRISIPNDPCPTAWYKCGGTMLAVMRWSRAIRASPA
jgi:hypothetical protein